MIEMDMDEEIFEKIPDISDATGGLSYLLYCRWWCHSLFMFTPYLGKIPILTNTFKMC